MPNIKSVIKDVKKSRKNHLRNISAKSAMKTYIKKAKTAVDGGDAQAAELVSQATSVIDKTAERGIIHKNAAARRKSRLMKRAAQAQSAPATTTAAKPTRKATPKAKTTTKATK